MSAKATKAVQKKEFHFNKKLAWRVLCIVLSVVMLASLVVPALMW